MTLDEAILHAEEREKACMKRVMDITDELLKQSSHEGLELLVERANNAHCAVEHRQLAEWLKELKQYRETKLP